MDVFKPFRVRSATRDADTDQERFDRIVATIAQVRGEIAREQEGLAKRYADSRRDAGFTEQALDEMPDKAKLATRLNQHSQTILQCEERLKTLDIQAQLLETVRASMSQLIAKPD